MLVGNVAGSFVAGPLADSFGRKWGMFIANIVVIIGSVVQAAAFKRRDVIVGRVILGIGSVLLGKIAFLLRSVAPASKQAHRTLSSVLYCRDIPSCLSRGYDGTL